MNSQVLTPQSIRQDPNLNQSLRVAIVDEELPWPLTSGKRIRTFNLISRLADQHEITYVAYRNPDIDEQEQAIQKFKELGIRSVVVDRVLPPKSGAGFYLRLFGNLFSSHPYSVEVHNSAKLRATLSDLERRDNIDLWHSEWTPYAEMTKHLTRAPRLVMAHNVESLIWHRYYLNETNPLKKWFIKQQWRKWQKFETEVTHTCGCVVAVTDEDAHRFRNEMSGQNITVVDNGVDTEFFSPSETVRDVHHLLFLGSLDWRPNLDGIAQFLEHVLPEVVTRIPSTQVTIVGRNPPEWLRAKAAGIPSVNLIANVPDVRPYLHQCSMLVVPLRIGGGSRLKILEALSTETPVLSTAIGAEGLRLEPDHHLSIVDSIEAMSCTIPDLLQTPEQLQAQASRGRDVVLESYDWNVLATRLNHVWHSCAVHSHQTWS